MMVPPAAVVILSPLIFGIGLGPEMLAGVLLGAISSGFVLGGMMNAAGGAWDNAKKMNEKNGQKGSFKHKSTVVVSMCVGARVCLLLCCILFMFL